MSLQQLIANKLTMFKKKPTVIDLSPALPLQALLGSSYCKFLPPLHSNDTILTSNRSKISLRYGLLIVARLQTKLSKITKLLSPQTPPKQTRPNPAQHLPPPRALRPSGIPSCPITPRLLVLQLPLVQIFASFKGSYMLAHIPTAMSGCYGSSWNMARGPTSDYTQLSIHYGTTRT